MRLQHSNVLWCLSGWKKIVQVGAVDCARASNIGKCLKYSVHKYPTIKVHWLKQSLS